MSEIRNLTKTEIFQAETLAAELANCLDKVCASESIDNFGVVSSAFLIIFGSLMVECLEEEDRHPAAKIFFEHVNRIIDSETTPPPLIN